ncbi:peptidase S15, partial [Mesorhizobium sp. M4B.F.Ca.ET.089.01.1.1]|uniref:CocE/NonD family hydrolase C-terminal non-catalytic domain-containing protein n=1 Tax=Mesorhizobium sp. M4B.F.Ca.ET.089.01.1.1 TaxID=2496662 RepID=UPI000FF1FDE6
LSHRHDDLAIQPMLAGKIETILLKLRCCGQRFEAGERIRLAVATSHWPIVFPMAEKATLSIHCGASRLILPVREAQPLDTKLAAFPGPESARPMEQKVLVEAEPFQRSVWTDHITGLTVHQVLIDAGTILQPHTGITQSARNVDRFSINPDDPNSAEGTCTWENTFSRDNWKARIAVSATVRALRHVWRMETYLIAHDGDEVVVERSEVKEYPRDLN